MSVYENLYITHAQKKVKPFSKVLMLGTDVQKVSVDVLMKTCDMLSKIMVILDSFIVSIFVVGYYATFLEFSLKDCRL